MNLRDFGAGFSLGFATRSMVSRLFKTVASAVRGIFKTTIDLAKSEFNEAVKTGTFDIEKAIETDEKTFRTGSQIRNWIKTYYVKNKYSGFLLQGHMYLFDYDDPALKGKLDFYDTSPLILSLGIYHAKTGNLIEYGVNLHLLPDKVRKAFVTDVFNMFKKRFKGEMYSNEPRAVNEFTWDFMKTAFVDKYHIDFAVRSYIHERRKNCCYIDYADWSKAILVPSKGFVGVTEASLKRLYQIHKYRKVS